ncbi:MAG: SPASM domain-containing protein [Candidatus Margulisbacteria bacterium]|nr:SPASM domain-containing protein [Candidatus Margulisiibacteriota bacterium]
MKRKIRGVICLENTTGCNLACSYCYAAKKHSKAQGSSFKTIKKSLDFFYDYFSKSNQLAEFHLDFTGTGEPLLNFRLLAQTARYILSRKDKSPVFLRFTTNGLLFNRSIINRMKAYNKKNKLLFHFSLSCDGPFLINDLTRKDKLGNGIGDRLLKTIIDLKKTGLFQLVDNAVCTYTFDRPLLVYRLMGLVLLGFEEVVMKPYRGLDPKYRLTAARLKTVKRQYRELTDFLLSEIVEKRDYSCFFALFNPGDFFGRFLLRVYLGAKQERRCPAGDTQFYVDRRGDIFLCPSFSCHPETALGNVNKGIASSLLPARNASGLFKECEKCWAKKYCGGECPYDTYIRGASKPDRLNCQLKQFMTEEANRFFSVLKVKKPKAFKDINVFLEKKQHHYFDYK